jgi:hypothetical protein
MVDFASGSVSFLTELSRWSIGLCSERFDAKKSREKLLRIN